MLKKLLALAAICVFVLGLGCSSSNPTVPDGDRDLVDFFSQFDLSSQVVGEFTYINSVGEVVASGYLGRNDDGDYIIEDRNAQKPLEVWIVNTLSASITYNNPHGTVPSGPNEGLPYYLIGQTMDYDIIIHNKTGATIGGNHAGNWTLAELTAEQRYAHWGVDKKGKKIAIPDGLLPGEPVFDWTGVFPGKSDTVINDLFTIVPGTLPGLDVTTVRIIWPWYGGWQIKVYWDGVAGIWDPM